MNPPGDRPNGRARLVALAVLVLATGFFAQAVWQLQMRTVDDGFIFFRLAQNFVDGHGIVWNVGGEPTEGATNFLHFLALSGLMATGLDPRVASLWLSATCAVLVVLVVWRTWGRRLGALAPAGAAVVAIYLVDARMTVHAATGGLGGLIDALAAVLAWRAALDLVERSSTSRALVFGLAGFAASIARPTGALFVAVLYLVLLVSALRDVAERSERVRAVLSAAAVTAVGGAAFAAWKLATFGYLLPNSYYLKSTARTPVQWEALASYLAYALTPLALVAVLALAFGTRAAWREAGERRHARTCLFLTLLPPATVVLYYTSSTVVSTANFRFYFPSYAFLFAGVLALLPIASRGRARTGWITAAAFLALGLALVRSHESGLLVYPPEKAPRRPLEHELVRLGRALGRTGLGHEATLLNDSAGAIPFYSGFRHVDRGGLVTNELSGRTPITALEREEFIWGQDLDVYIGWEPQATIGVEDWKDDPRVHTPYVKICLVRDARDATTLRTFPQSMELLHLRMRELRDRWQLLGQLEPAGYWEDAWNVKCLAYVRRDSPHKEEIARVLDGLIERGPRQVDWQAVPKGAETEYLAELHERTGGDFAKMAELFLGDRRLAPLVRARYRMLH